MINDLILTARLDALVTDLDTARERLRTTKGESAVLFTLLLAEVLHEGDKKLLDLSLGYILARLTDDDPQAEKFFDSLLKHCDIQREDAP